jgi:hypothetical protein
MRKEASPIKREIGVLGIDIAKLGVHVVRCDRAGGAPEVDSPQCVHTLHCAAPSALHRYGNVWESHYWAHGR